jgi:uncharacterized membrane protein
MMTSSAESTNRARLLAYLMFALLAVSVVSLHTYHFQGRPYRQDEAWIVHGTLEKHSVSEMTQWVAVNIHPPLWVAVADWWVDSFGQQEVMARTLSTLFTLLTLAFVFRLSTDLFGYSVGLWAVFLLGAASFFQFYGHEFRPYSALSTCTVALQLTFMRWVRKPDFRHALAFVTAGIAALYVHFFAFYVLASLALFLIVFARWNKGLYLRAAGLFLAIGLSYLGWTLPFLYAINVTNPGGINYALNSNWNTLMVLYSRMWLRPYELGGLLFLTAAFVPVNAAKNRLSSLAQSVSEPFRFNPDWRKWYPLFIPAGILLLAYVVNQHVHNMTQRSLVILIPSMAIFLAYGLVTLPRPAQFALALLVIPGIIPFLDFEITGPQAEVAAYISEDYKSGEPVIMNVPIVPRQIALNYYIQNRMTATVPNDLMWQVLEPRQPYLDFMPNDPVHPMYDTSEASLDALRHFIGNAPVVWYVERQGGTRFTNAITALLRDEGYEEARSREWKGEYAAVEFERAAG